MNPKFSNEATPVKLYRTPKSGHCHRVELMMSFLDIPYEPVDLDMAAGAHKAPEFLKHSPFGQVPVIDDNGVNLSDSNAIVVYLVSKYGNDYDWMPTDPIAAAEVQRWLSIAAGQIASGPCAARLCTLFNADLDWENAKAIANSLFEVMEGELSGKSFLTGSSINIADVAGYSYIAHAPEGGVSLEPYPAIRDWLKRVESHPGFVPMVASPHVA